MPFLHTRSEQLTDLPRLGRPMAQIAIPAGLVRRMQMRVEHLHGPPGPPGLVQLEHRTGHALARVPVPTPEGRRAAVEHVRVHAGLHDGEPAQDDQPSPDEPAVVELAVREHGCRGGAQLDVVAVHPHLLQPDNVPRRPRGRDAPRDLVQPLAPPLRDILEPPAVEAQDV